MKIYLNTYRNVLVVYSYVYNMPAFGIQWRRKKNSLIIHSSNNWKEKKTVTKTWHVKPVILLLMHICLRGQRFAYP